MRVSLFARKNVLLQLPERHLQKDESTLSYFFVVPPFFLESSHFQAQQDTKAIALISLCGNGHNTVQTYFLLLFQSDAPRCIHDKRYSAPLTSRQLSVRSPEATSSLQSLLPLILASIQTPLLFVKDFAFVFSQLNAIKRRHTAAHTPFLSKSAAAFSAPFTILLS